MAFGLSNNPQTALQNGLPFGTFNPNFSSTLPVVQQNQQQEPNMSTTEGPKVGNLTQPPLKTQPKVTLPSPIQSSIAGVNSPTVGSDFGAPQGADQTQVTNMPTNVQQNISTDMQNQQTPTDNTNMMEPLKDLGATILANPSATPEQLQKTFPEFSGVDKQIFADLGATILANPSATPEQIMKTFPELSSGGKSNFDSMNPYEKMMYIPKTDAEKATLPRWKQQMTPGTLQNDTEVDRKSRAVGAAFITELPNVLTNVLSWAGNNPATRAMFGKTEVEKLTGEIKQRGQSLKDQTYGSLGTTEGEGGLGEQAAKFAMDTLPTLLLPEGEIAEGIGGVADALKGTPIISQLLEKVPMLSKVLDNPLVAKVLKGAIASNLGMETYNIASQGKGETPLEAGIATTLGIGTPLLMKGIKSIAPTIANRLELAGIMTPAKLDNIKNKLIDEGVDGADKMTADDVAKTMLNYGIQGNKSQIVEKTAGLAKQTENAVDDLLSKSTTQYKDTIADSLLPKLKEEYNNSISTAGKENYDKVVKYIEKSKTEGLTLTELNDIKRMGWDLGFGASGKVPVAKADLVAANSELKTFIENESDKTLPSGLDKGTIKILNNRTQFFRSISSAVAKKESNEVGSKILNFTIGHTPGSLIGGIAGFEGGKQTGRNVLWTTIAGALLGGITDSTKWNSYLANKIADKMGTKEATILQKYIDSRGATALTPEIENTLQKLADDTVTQARKAQPYSMQGDGTYKPNFRQYEAPKALPDNTLTPNQGGNVTTTTSNPSNSSVKELSSPLKKVNIPSKKPLLPIKKK